MALLFVVLADLCRRTLSQPSVAPIPLTARDGAAFAEALANPPAPNKHLREAARRHRDLIAE